jgi:hypothetical protein
VRGTLKNVRNSKSARCRTSRQPCRQALQARRSLIRLILYAGGPAVRNTVVQIKDIIRA